MRSARCLETGTPGAGSGPGKRAGRKTGTAPRADFTTHISAAMRALIGARSGWLTEVRLPSYAPELNPAEGVWANMKNGLGNLAARDVDQLAAIMKSRLKHIQYRPALIEAFLAQTGLTLEPRPP